MSTMSPAQQRRVRTGDAILRFPDGAKATHADLEARRVVIFIHGFTADASYLQDLMHQFAGADFAPFAFEYACHRGIDHAAMSLVSLLRLLDHRGQLAQHKVVLLGHSMGGLVARAAVTLAGGQAYVRKVIALGTPHDGTLESRLLPRCMASWGEAVAGCHPRGFGPQAASALQLVKADPQPCLLDRLRDAPSPAGVTYYSISGGYNRLDFGASYWKNLVINNYLQRRLPRPNDGLVAEKSSDLSDARFAGNAPGCTHYKSYVGYSNANHSFLVNNQEIALYATACAR